MNRQPCRSAEVPGLLPECFRTFRSLHGLRLVLLTGFPDYRASRATASREALKMPSVLWVGMDQLVAGICITTEQHYLHRSFTYRLPSSILSLNSRHQGSAHFRGSLCSSALMDCSRLHRLVSLQNEGTYGPFIEAYRVEGTASSS